MRKRLTAWLLALVMALTLVGCGDDVTVIGVTTGGDQTQQQEQQDVLPDEGEDVPDALDDGADAAIDEDGSYTSKEDVALYIHTYRHLPGNLPEAEGRSYTECDIDTLGAGSRGAKRIVFSNDGLIYYTGDHYESFELLYGEE